MTEAVADLPAMYPMPCDAGEVGAHLSAIAMDQVQRLVDEGTLAELKEMMPACFSPEPRGERRRAVWPFVAA